MKKIVSLLCAIICANVLMAQQQTAILQHNDSTRVFYGAHSFVQAYNAATHGDIITLSDGVFDACDISKGITLRGNGAVVDTARGCYATEFSTQIRVSNIADSLQFEAEGIYFADLKIEQSSRNNKLVKCVTKEVNFVKNNTTAIDCILNYAQMYASSGQGMFTLINNVSSTKI